MLYGLYWCICKKDYQENLWTWENGKMVIVMVCYGKSSGKATIKVSRLRWTGQVKGIGQKDYGMKAEYVEMDGWGR